MERDGVLFLRKLYLMLLLDLVKYHWTIILQWSIAFLRGRSTLLFRGCRLEKRLDCWRLWIASVVLGGYMGFGSWRVEGLIYDLNVTYNVCIFHSRYSCFYHPEVSIKLSRRLRGIHVRSKNFRSWFGDMATLGPLWRCESHLISSNKNSKLPLVTLMRTDKLLAHQ